MADKMLSKEDELRKVPLFSGLGRKSLAEIARIADMVELPAGEVLVKEGSLGFDFIFILEGQAKAESAGSSSAGSPRTTSSEKSASSRTGRARRQSPPRRP